MAANHSQNNETFRPVRPDIAHGVYARTFCVNPARIALTRIVPGGGFAPHVDPYGHLFIFLAGNAELTCGPETQQVEPGAIHTIPAGTEHSVKNRQRQELLLLTCNLPPGLSLDMPVNNLFADIPDELPEEHFTPLLVHEDILLERIVSHGHITAPDSWYEQDRDEWVYLLAGGARLTFPEAAPRTLRSSEQVTLPAGLRHRVDWTDPATNSLWLALHY